MITFLITCVLILNSIHSHLPSRYIFPFSETKNNNFKITACIGKPTTCFPFKLSLSIKQVLILDGNKYKDGYKSKESDTFKQTSISLGKPFNEDYIYGKYGRDTIYIHNTNIVIENLQFIIIEGGINQENINYIGVIGIGHIYEYIDKDSGLIEKLLFNGSFKRNERNFSLMKTHLLIGTELNSIMELSRNKIIKKCKIVEDSSYEGLFACYVENSVIYDVQYKFIEEVFKEQKVKFSIEQNDFYVPLNMFNFIKNIMLPKKGKGECYEDVIKRGKHIIRCNFSTSNYATKNYLYYNLLRRKLYLMFDNWNIQFMLKDLFNWKEQYCRLMYYEHNKDWVLGRQFLDKYMLTIDRDENYIYLTNITNT